MAHLPLTGATGGPRQPSVPDGSRARLERELESFARHAARSSLGAAAVEPVERYAFILRPPGARGDGVDLMLSALLHGNEYGGLPVLNAICRHLEQGLIAPAISTAFVLFNVDAARRGLRCIERDMNRVFGRDDTSSLEDRRARELEPLAARARFSLDLHQTIEPSSTPFFVFNYQPMNLRFAHAVFPGVPVVTHWGRPFSAASSGGSTLDEFIHSRGGVAVSIELGHRGFGIYQIAAGVQVCLEAIAAVERLGRGTPLPPPSDRINPIYTWSAIVPYPPGPGRVILDEGLINFQPIEAGQRIGTAEGAPIVAPKAGLLLFPKYVRSDGEPRPGELYRLLRQPSLDELGRGDCLEPGR